MKKGGNRIHMKKIPEKSLKSIIEDYKRASREQVLVKLEKMKDEVKRTK